VAMGNGSLRQLQAMSIAIVLPTFLTAFLIPISFLFVTKRQKRDKLERGVDLHCSQGYLSLFRRFMCSWNMREMQFSSR
jgi:hypothetical protein